MSRLVVFAKSATIDSYVNVICHATSQFSQIDHVLFVWYAANESTRSQVRAELSKKLQSLPSFSACYQPMVGIIAKSRYDDITISKSRLSDFLDTMNLSRDFFDVTTLPKDDLISVISLLLAKDAKKVRFFHSYVKPMLLHEYESIDGEKKYAWLDLHDIIDEFLGFLERRDGRWVAIALTFALLAAAITSWSLKALSLVNWAELAVAFVSLVGGWFSIIWSSRYLYQIAKRWSGRARRHRKFP